MPMNEERANCRNCGELLAGEYCGHCGQREGRGDLSFGSLVGDMAEEVVSWDSRLWRTLVPLVFRPGFLTAEFIAGRRARYVLPFRLYLIISFALFLVVSLLARGTSYMDAEEGAAASPGVSVTVIDGDAPDGADIDTRIDFTDEDSAQWLKDLEARMENNAKSLSNDPGGFLQLLIEYLPQMMFLLLPVFALLLQFCYLFSPFHYLQHLVFSLHFHSFVYLLNLLGQLGHFWFPDNPVSEGFPFLILLYLPLALRRTYGSSLAGAAGKTVIIVVVDGVILLMSFALVSLLALALM